MFNFADIFTPQRMAQGAAGVQAINQMPWVFNQYGSSPLTLASLFQQPQQPSAAIPQPDQAMLPQTPISPLQALFGGNGGQDPLPANFWQQFYNNG